MYNSGRTRYRNGAGGGTANTSLEFDPSRSFMSDFGVDPRSGSLDFGFNPDVDGLQSPQKVNALKKWMKNGLALHGSPYARKQQYTSPTKNGHGQVGRAKTQHNMSVNGTGAGARTRSPSKDFGFGQNTSTMSQGARRFSTVQRPAQQAPFDANRSTSSTLGGRPQTNQEHIRRQSLNSQQGARGSNSPMKPPGTAPTGVKGRARTHSSANLEQDFPEMKAHIVNAGTRDYRGIQVNQRFDLNEYNANISR